MKRTRENSEANSFDLMPSAQRTLNGGLSVVKSVCHLPVELLEMLFAHLSLTDLFHCQLVCRQWNEIISRDGFLVWRKMYYRVKLKNEDNEVKQYIVKKKLNSHGHFVKNLVSFIKELMLPKFTSKHLNDQLLPLLRSHSQYQFIESSAVLQKMLSEDEDIPGSVLLTTIVLLIVLSKNVFQTKQVFDDLLKFTTVDRCTELFYCLSTIFYHLWTVKVIPQRLHYQTYYVLKSFEKFKSHSDVKGLTQEQLAIVNHPISPGQIVKVIAFAGTGKTTCLVHLAANNPHKRFLYLCFNNSVASHAKTVFGRNVTCKTLHSQAYGPFVDIYGRGKVFPGSLNDSHIKKEVKFPFKVDETTFCRYIIDTLEDFMASADPVITMEHVPPEPEDYHVPLNKVLTQAQSLWRLMTDPSNKTVKMPHDGYLKFYQLQKSKIPGYNCILVDEAQDLTPAFISVIEAQSCPKVIVGDPHQQIYGFRKAINALEALQPTHTYYLTESFRFGPNIAFVTSCLLDTLKGVHKQTLTGGYQSGGYSGVVEGQVAYIARTHLKLFEKMVKTVTEQPQAKIAFAGRLESYDFDMILDIHRYKTRSDLHLVSHGLVRKFLERKQPFYKLVDYAKKMDDVQLSGKIKICEKYGKELPRLIDTIKERAGEDDIETADVVFSTAHKSKGLEFDTVILTEDYLDFEKARNIAIAQAMSRGLPVPDPGDFSIDISEVNVDEKNLAYVAVTRAKKQVFLNKSVVKVLSEGKEFFVCPIVSFNGFESEKCAKCGNFSAIDDCRFHKEDLLLGDQVALPRTGDLCLTCSTVYVPRLASLVSSNN